MNFGFGPKVLRPVARYIFKLVIIAALLVIAAFAFLTPSGQWQADEFDQMAQMRVNGIEQWWQVTSHWAVRPFSNLILLGYERITDLAAAPMIAPFLLTLWAGLGAALWFGFADIPPSRRMLLASATFALLLTAYPVAEVFYWPMGAVAYVPALSGIAFVCARGAACGVWRPRDQWISATTVAIAALSLEVAAIFALCLAVFVVVLARPRLWTLPPALLSVAVLWTLARGRVRSGDIGFADPHGPVHQGIPSLMAALHWLAHSLPGVGGHAAIIVVLAFAAIVCLLPRRDVRSPALAIGIAALLTVILATAAVFYQFGAMCCERHSAFPAMIFLLALLPLGRVVADIRPGGSSCAMGAALLLAALGAGVLPRSRALLHDWSIRHDVARSEHALWRSGQSPGPTLVLTRPPPGDITNNFVIASGQTTLSTTTPLYERLILTYFGKTALDVQ